MVGIITHIPELHDDFAQQVIVTKHQASRLRRCAASLPRRDFAPARTRARIEIFEPSSISCSTTILVLQIVRPVRHNADHGDDLIKLSGRKGTRRMRFRAPSWSPSPHPKVCRQAAPATSSALASWPLLVRQRSFLRCRARHVNSHTETSSQRSRPTRPCHTSAWQ